MLIFSIRVGETFFQKGKGKYRLTLINSHLVFSVLIRLVLTVRIPFQINDSLSALFLYLCVNFHKCVSVLQMCQRFVQRVAICMVTIDFTKREDLKQESSEAYLLHLRKICRIGFQSFFTFFVTDSRMRF